MPNQSSRGEVVNIQYTVPVEANTRFSWKYVNQTLP